MPFTDAQVRAAATAIANVRAMRRGAPAISNVLEVLKDIQGGRLHQEVIEDARAALETTSLSVPAALRELSEKATQGPWRADLMAHGARAVEAKAADGLYRDVCSIVRGGSPQQADANAELIVAAVNFVRSLLDKEK